MNVNLNFLGLFKEHIGEETVSMELPENADYGELLDEIGRRYGKKLPKTLWDHEKREFQPGILCVGEGRDLETRNTIIKPEETISIVVHMAGG